jgi:hypothetical protein
MSQHKMKGKFRAHPPSHLPIGSMYAIYANIYDQYTPNVSIYAIHGSYGLCRLMHVIYADVNQICHICHQSQRRHHFGDQHLEIATPQKHRKLAKLQFRNRKLRILVEVPEFLTVSHRNTSLTCMFTGLH